MSRAKRTASPARTVGAACALLLLFKRRTRDNRPDLRLLVSLSSILCPCLLSSGFSVSEFQCFSFCFRPHPRFGGGKHGFESWIITDAIEIGIDFGVIDKTCAHLFECRAEHLQGCLLILQ